MENRDIKQPQYEPIRNNEESRGELRQKKYNIKMRTVNWKEPMEAFENGINTNI